MASHLYAFHDANSGWGNIIRDAGMSGWAVISESIGDDPTNRTGVDYRWLSAYHVTPIVRLNFSHHGEGSIPKSDRYDEFAVRCANFVSASSGCVHWIIGNETNWADERPGGVPVQPSMYADCFAQCRRQIRRRGEQHQCIVAAVAPYNEQTGWCIDYWRDVLSTIIMQSDGAVGAEGLALHAYSRGGDPNSIFSEDKMDAPHNDCYNGFRAYRDFLDAVPAVMHGLPAYITETDQIDPWVDRNSGWVRNAYSEIHEWNRHRGNQSIHCLALYRWQKHDQWYIDDKQGVIDDFREAVKQGYISPITPSSPIDPPEPEPPDRPPVPEPPAPEPAPGPGHGRDIDPRLLARGVTFDFAHPPAGTWYWRMTKAQWLDHAAQQVGPDHHILGRILALDKEFAGIPLRVDWPSGNTTVTSKADDPNASYNYDYGMSASLNEYSIYVADGNPSDRVYGIGMGKDGNAREHTSTWLDFEWVQVAESVGPEPEPEPEPIPEVRLVHPLPAAVITQNFYEESDAYEQYGFRAHNGCDLGGLPLRTPIRSITDGIVAMSDFDPGYGHYVRLDYRQLDAYVMFCHLDEPGAATGTRVKAGETVGLLGSSGNSTGPHTHTEVRLHNADGTYREDTPMSKGRVDPRTFFILHGLKL
jgi:murein DD-endopeptidase MepM/ murein hydrolase activator NlpD